jgi:hypothetical protein
MDELSRVLADLRWIAASESLRQGLRLRCFGPRGPRSGLFREVVLEWDDEEVIVSGAARC